MVQLSASAGFYRTLLVNACQAFEYVGIGDFVNRSGSACCRVQMGWFQPDTQNDGRSLLPMRRMERRM